MTTDQMNEAAVVIVKLTKKCHAVPSQWEGRCNTGQDIYIRFRWGQFGIGLGWTDDEAIENTVYEDFGDPTDGYLRTSDLAANLPDWLTISPDCTIKDPYGDMPFDVWRREILGYDDE